MEQPAIKFEDGAAYEHAMGAWSRIVGAQFLDWVDPQPGLRWADIGCGNGVFSAQLSQSCAPAEIQGIDPSPGQLAFAHTRTDTPAATFQQGDAMALPFPDHSFDAAAMALVLFFIPDPARGLAEARRIVKPGGLVCAYVWDVLNGGMPIEPMREEFRALGVTPPNPPRADVSPLEKLRASFVDAGFMDVETRVLPAHRAFADFDDYWRANHSLGGSAALLATMPPADSATLKQRLQARMPRNPDGTIAASARANAVKARVPAPG